MHEIATIRKNKLSDGSATFDVLLWDGATQVCALAAQTEDVAYNLWAMINNSVNGVSEYEGEPSLLRA